MTCFNLMRSGFEEMILIVEFFCFCYFDLNSSIVQLFSIFLILHIHCVSSNGNQIYPLCCFE